MAHLVSREYAARGHDVLVVAAATGAGGAGESALDGMRVRRVWAPTLSALRLHTSLINPIAIAQVRRAAADFRPDIVHAHNVHERLSFGALGAARAGGAPLVLTAHDYLLFCLTKFLCSAGDTRYTANPETCPHCKHIRRVPRRNAAVRRLIERNVSKVACISAAQREVLEHNGFGGVRREVVHNGISPAVPHPDDAAIAAFRRQHGIDARPLVFFGGRISGAKGGDQLLRAVVAARRRIDCQLAIAGDRPQYFAVARRIAAEEGLPDDALRTLGWLEGEQLDLAFAASDVCATPSVYPDPFNLMNLRAMAHGRPVVGTRYGGTPEVVSHGETGLIADPWDPDAFGAALASLLLDPARARMMGEAGQRRLVSLFTLERQVTQYLALLERERCA